MSNYHKTVGRARLKFSNGTRNIRFDRFPRFKLQVQTPRWSFENGDYYLMFPTVLRMFNDVKDGFGAGFTVLGFGVGIYLGKEGI